VNQSIQYNANEWEAYNFRSGLLLSQGHLQLALKDLNKSFTINANEATTLIARGKLKIQLGDLQGACSDLTQVASWGFDEFEPWINENCNK
jgi:tetratricopeptide (TPR) repeat protein